MRCGTPDRRDRGDRVAVIDPIRLTDPGRVADDAAMSDDVLIAKVRGRAHDPETRIDEAKLGSPRLAAPATPRMIADAEARIGRPFHLLHRRLLAEIGSGGFGPGYGMIGLAGGHVDEGRCALDLAKELGLPDAILPFCD